LRTLAVSGSLTPEDVRLFHEGAFDGIELNVSRGWRGTNLDLLLTAKGLRALSVVGTYLEHINVISKLHSLEALDLVTLLRGQLDLSGLHNLRKCSLDYVPGLASAFELTNLTSLFVNRMPKAKVNTISKMVDLRNLGILSCGADSIGFLSPLSQLENLRLARFRNLSSIAPLAGLHSLRTLKLQDCRGAHSLEPLRELRQLRSIALQNCGPYDSLLPLKELTDLEEVVLYGKERRVLDESYAVLKSLPNLKVFQT